MHLDNFVLLWTLYCRRNKIDTAAELPEAPRPQTDSPINRSVRITTQSCCHIIYRNYHHLRFGFTLLLTYFRSTILCFNFLLCVFSISSLSVFHFLLFTGIITNAHLTILISGGYHSLARGLTLSWFGFFQFCG